MALAESRSSIFKSKPLLRIGKIYGSTYAQIALKFLIQNGIIIISQFHLISHFVRVRRNPLWNHIDNDPSKGSETYFVVVGDLKNEV